MAYMNQEKKAKIAPEVKRLLAKYDLKGSLSVEHNSTLVLTIKSGGVDFLGADRVYHRRENLYRTGAPETHMQVNTHHLDSAFSGKALEALAELRTAMNTGNHDNSDIQSDYFDVGWYADINIGKWDKPYQFTGQPRKGA